MFAPLAGLAVPAMRDGRNTIAAGELLDLAAEAKPEKARQLRACFQHRLQTLGAPAPLVEDLSLAAYEALTNVVEHAYHPGHPSNDQNLWMSSRRGEPSRRMI